MNAAADIYRTNMFHLAVGGCALVLQKDLEYWAIDELMMEPCCALKYYPEIEICHNEKQVRRWRRRRRVGDISRRINDQINEMTFTYCFQECLALPLWDFFQKSVAGGRGKA